MAADLVASRSEMGVVTHPPGWAAAEQPQRVIISLRDISKTYESATGDRVQVLKGLHLDVEAGSFNVIRGESGSGKTSLLRILGMLDQDFEGEYLFGGEPVKERPTWLLDELRAANIGFIFQEGRLFEHMDVQENVAVPIRLQGSAEERRRLKDTINSLAPAFFNSRSLTAIRRSSAAGRTRLPAGKSSVPRSCGR